MIVKKGRKEGCWVNESAMRASASDAISQLAQRSCLQASYGADGNTLGLPNKSWVCCDLVFLSQEPLNILPGVLAQFHQNTARRMPRD